MKKLLFFLLPFVGLAQIPEYYEGIDFNDRAELQTELSDLITATHTNSLRYTPGVWDVLKQSDLVPSDSTKVLLIYGFDDTDAEQKNDRTRGIGSTNNGGCGSCIGRWEREHVFPQSLANPRMSTSSPGTGTDAHNLRAVDRQMNSSRSNRAYVDYSGNATIVGADFYPGDEWIGDVARIMMYMKVRYNDAQTQVCDPNLLASNSTNVSSPDMPDLFLKWNALDPPSEYELIRNEVIYEKQGNRNPFIDNPYLATLTWGGQTAQNSWTELSTNQYQIEEIKIEVSPNPATDVVNIIAKQFKSANLYSIEGILLQTNLKDKFSIAQYPSGVYILAITLENGKIVTKKVIKK